MTERDGPYTPAAEFLSGSTLLEHAHAHY